MNILKRELFNITLHLSPIRWQKAIRRSSIIQGLCGKASLIIFDGLSKEICIAAYLFSKEVIRLVRKSGPLFTALYLKQCSSSLQMSYGTLKFKHSLLPVPIALTRTGLPRIIPSFYRMRIRRRDDRADLLVQLYLSFFSLAKLIELAPKISSATFSSISTPATDLDSIVGFVSKVKTKMKSLFDRYCPFIRSIPVYQGMEWVPTWKAIPTNSLVKWACELGLLDGSEEKGVLDVVRRFAKHKSLFTALHFELFSLTFLLEQIHAGQDHFSPGVLWPHRVRFAFDPNNTRFTNSDLDWFERVLVLISRLLPRQT